MTDQFPNIPYIDGTEAPQYASKPQSQPPYGYDPYYQPPTKSHRMNWAATLALVLALVGLGSAIIFPLCFVWLTCSAAALVFAIVAKAKRAGGGKATAALICAIIGLVFNLLITALLFSPYLTMLEQQYSTDYSQSDYSQDL